MPADVGPGPVFFEHTDAEVLLNDGSWVWCLVIGQRKDRHGRWCVGIRYYPNAAIGESGGWYLFDSRHIRRIRDLKHTNFTLDGPRGHSGLVVHATSSPKSAAARSLSAQRRPGWVLFRRSGMPWPSRSQLTAGPAA
jgi:hypothetical protein